MSDADELETSVIRGRKLGRYVLRYEIAAGGMGHVYLAQQRGAAGVERWVALKVLKDELAREAKFVRMFLDEARILSRVNHPNVCGVVDFGEVDGNYYLAMEYLHGETLSALSRRLRAARAADPSLAPAEVVARVVADAARGLHAAHEQKGPDGAPFGIVHRDVSPQNIFVLYDGIAKVMDFGIAAARLRESKTTTGEFKGKFAYAAPEQLTGRPVDRRTDVFALGIVLWEACLGRRLFRAETEGETVLNVMQKEVAPPDAFEADFPRAVSWIALRALERDPARRHQTAAEMADDLEEWLATLGRPLGQAQISTVMRRIFADRLATRDAMMHSDGPPAGIVPEVELDSKSSIATVADAGQSSVRMPARRKRVRAAVAAALVLVVGTGAVALWARSESPAPRAEAPAARPPATTAPPPSATSAPAAQAPTAAPATAAADAHSAGTGRLNLLAIPTADVYLGGRRIGTTPLRDKRLPAGIARLRLVPEGGGEAVSIAVQIRAGRTTSKTVRLGR